MNLYYLSGIGIVLILIVGYCLLVMAGRASKDERRIERELGERTNDPRNRNL